MLWGPRLLLLNSLLHLRHWVLASHHHRYFITAKFAVLFCPGVDSFHFRAAWILSTRLLSVVGFVLRWSGFFPLKCLSAQVSSWLRGAASPSPVCLHESELRAQRLGGQG